LEFWTGNKRRGCASTKSACRAGDANIPFDENEVISSPVFVPVLLFYSLLDSSRLHALLQFFPSSRDMEIAPSGSHLTWPSTSTCSSTYVRSSFVLPTHNYGIKLWTSRTSLLFCRPCRFPCVLFLIQSLSPRDESLRCVRFDILVAIHSIHWYCDKAGRRRATHNPRNTSPSHIPRYSSNERDRNYETPRDEAARVPPPFHLFRSKRNMSGRN